MNWEEKIKKKTKDAQKLEKWFLSYIFRLKINEKNIDTICANLPNGEDLLKLFNERRYNTGDFFAELLKEAIKKKITIKKQKSTPVQTPLKLQKRGYPANYNTYDLVGNNGKRARINEFDKRTAFIILKKYEEEECGHWPISELLSFGKTVEDLKEVEHIKTTSGISVKSSEFKQKKYGVVGYPKSYK